MLLFLIPKSKQDVTNLVVCCDAFADFARLDVFSNASAHCISSGLVFLLQKDSLVSIEDLPLLFAKCVLGLLTIFKELVVSKVSTTWKCKKILTFGQQGPTKITNYICKQF